jgi:hypothetical protein
MRRLVALVALLAVALAGAALAGCGDDHRGGAAAAWPGSTAAPRASTTTSAAPPGFAASVHEVTAADLPASWRPGCPVPVDQLRAIDARHWGFDGQVHEGRIVVAADRVDDVVGVLGDLFAARYPIERMEPVDAYGGDDLASVEANNTSAFNCRPATGSTTRWSEHAYGRAVDLNPRVNPYVVGDRVVPESSRPYLDRTRTDLGLVRDGDPAVVAFESRGWTWGGRWRTSKDYQHFSPTARRGG